MDGKWVTCISEEPRLLQARGSGIPRRTLEAEIKEQTGWTSLPLACSHGDSGEASAVRWPRGVLQQLHWGPIDERRGLDPHDDGSSVPTVGVSEAAQVPPSPGNTVPAHRPGACWSLALAFLFWTSRPKMAKGAGKTCGSFSPQRAPPL